MVNWPKGVNTPLGWRNPKYSEEVKSSFVNSRRRTNVTWVLQSKTTTRFQGAKHRERPFASPSREFTVVASCYPDMAQPRLRHHKRGTIIVRLAASRCIRGIPAHAWLVIGLG